MQLVAFVINIKKKNNMGSALYQRFIGKKKDTDTRVNWNDNPINEEDKVKHPKYKKAMSLINKHDAMVDSPEKTKFFIDSLETPTIKFNNKSYSMQALLSD